MPAWIEPKLAKSGGPTIPTGPGWVYEPKLDGYRTAMRIGPTAPRC